MGGAGDDHVPNRTCLLVVLLELGRVGFLEGFDSRGEAFK